MLDCKQIYSLNQEYLYLPAAYIAVCYINIFAEGALSKSCRCLCWQVVQKHETYEEYTHGKDIIPSLTDKQ